MEDGGIGKRKVKSGNQSLRTQRLSGKEMVWPPKTCPRPSLGLRPAIEEFRLHGGIYRRGAENAEGLLDED
jgi:hypothetical protein